MEQHLDNYNESEPMSSISGSAHTGSDYDGNATDLSTPPEAGSIDWANALEVQKLWTNNSTTPEEIHSCVHDIFAQNVQEHPDAPAVCAWDGDLTYKQLDYSSSRLANYLTDIGIRGTLVPLCFNKSKWVPVAALAVMKAGAACVLLDTSVPSERLKSIVIQLSPTAILTTHDNAQDIASTITDAPLVILSEAFIKDLDQPKTFARDRVDPASPLYIVFTSGSTGVPKGVIITHANFASAVKHQQKALGFVKNSRVLDFASYAFDVAWSNIIHTLTVGGCLCIPSQQDVRSLQVANAINQQQVNLLLITPTVARFLEPEELPSLRTIILTGEAVKKIDTARWQPYCEVYNAYGPAECTVTSTATVVEASEIGSPTIGIGIGANTWIVDADLGQHLLTPGSIGELWLEGPIVGAGYLNNPEKTKAVFVKDPSWLLQGALDIPGRRGTLYKTGDLARQNLDGSISYLGRKDTQVKIRGQRLELSDVEHHVRLLASVKITEVVAEVIVPGADQEPMLVVFLVLPDEEASQSQISTFTSSLEKALTEQLPTFMVPGAYLPLPSIPRTATGKTDRKSLKEIGAQLVSSQKSEPFLEEVSESLTSTENIMRALWSSVLNISPSKIAKSDSFLRVGGDSIAAIRLIGAARRQGISLVVTDVFAHPRLYELSALIDGRVQNGIENVVAPFSLLKPEIDCETARQQTAELCSVSHSDVDDILPCSALQEGLLALTIRNPGDYVSEIIVELRPDVDPSRFQKAWDDVAASASILRTRIVDLPHQGLVQVVLRTPMIWYYCNLVSEYREKVLVDPMTLGSSLSRVGLIQDLKQGKTFFAWTLHHAIYDAWSLPIIQEAIEKSYQGDFFEPFISMSALISYLITVRDQTAFWKTQLTDCSAPQFPALPDAAYSPKPDTTVTHRIDDVQWPEGSVTATVVTRAVLALAIKSLSRSDDTVFGVVVTGRQAPVYGIDRLAGPTIATVPMRIQVDESSSIDDFLQKIQQMALNMIPFEQTGLQNIQKISEECRRACQFQTLLVVQSTDRESLPSRLFTNDLARVDDFADAERPDLASTHALSLVCHVEKHALRLRMIFDKNVISEQHAERLVQSIEHILRQICSLDKASSKIQDILTLSRRDLDTIWAWNANVPETVDTCIHQLISQRALSQPDAPAIHAWDGQLTYGRLEELSTQLACVLLRDGIGGPGTTTPLCFEKSMWTSVGVLGVMKTGGACVLMDATQPEDRLRTIMEQTGSHHILSGFSTSVLASRIAGTPAVVIDEISLIKMENILANEDTDCTLPIVHPNSPLYVVFTSGSTGRPKGVVISHTNFASEVQYATDKYRFKPTSRVADFASHAFDVAWSNMINTLTTGGCLCIPSEHERKNDFVGFCKRIEVNYLDVTPTFASTLDWTLLPNIDTLVVGGEYVDTDRMRYFDHPESILITYGPSECTITATTVDCKATKVQPGTIGTGCGLVTWIVDPDTNALLPVGAIGELMLEGPLVGQGYLKDAEKTAAAFIEDPDWLVRGSATVAGRSGRLYKTGDLVKYEDDGFLTFVARKDNQVKIRGQRVELSEIEYHIRQLLSADEASQVVVEVITIGESKRQLLVAFLVVPEPSNLGTLQNMYLSFTADLNRKLAFRLPTYMVPSAYIPIDSIPMSATGKADRRALRLLVANMGLEDFRDLNEHKPMILPTTDMEFKLQLLWASILDIDPSRISTNDNFIQLGGDSIAAMRLVSAARQQNMLVTVADILRSSQLDQLALLMAQHDKSDDDVIEPFSLLQSNLYISDVRREAASKCNIGEMQIMDVFPCTALQEGLLAMTIQRTGDYVSRIVTELDPTVSIERFQAAIGEVVTRSSVLRTRIIELPCQGFVQVILQPSALSWHAADSVKTYQQIERVEEQNETIMSLGTDLTRFGIVKEGSRHYFAWTQHHALYDGWSLPLLQDAIEKVYIGNEIPVISGLQPFVKHIMEQRGTRENTFWQKQFFNFEAPQFPTLPSPSYRPKANKKAIHSAQNVRWPARFTPASVIRTAWSMLVSCHSGSLDTVFGAVVSGRQAPIDRIENIIGPTIATVPIRVRLGEGIQVEELLEQVQQQSLDMIPFEQTGLQNIRQMCQEADGACQFQSLLVVQPTVGTAALETMVFQKNIAEDDTADFNQNGDTFNTYALAVTCQQNDSSLQIQMSFDSQIISEEYAHRILHQLEHIIHQVCSASEIPSSKISDLDMTSPQDLSTIWRWNSHVPDVVDMCVHEIFAQTVRDQPDAFSVSAWDGELTYAELDRLSSCLALQLLTAGVGPGVFVPLCFDKSMWVPVAVLGVMKTGAASVALDTAQPKERLQDIVEQLAPLIIITSEAQQDLATEITNVPRVVVGNSVLYDCQCSDLSLPVANPSFPLYMVFTSGSTGRPKGAIVTHRNFSSAIRHQQEKLLFRKSSRVFDFTSYAFDVFWSNILHTLTSGGCFCIPSQDERMSAVVDVINRLHVNYAHFTPTLGRILEPSEMPGLETVVFSGEALKRSDVARWTSQGIQVLDTYGPAECTVTSTMSIVDPHYKDDPPIGHALGTVTWIVRPDGQGLSAIGTIGELWLEGPLIGNGYLNNPEKTAAAFVKDPRWLLSGCPSVGISGRLGRLYKTGDLVRYNDGDHSLQYLGRNDTQVKLRGQRIELGEVEHHVQALVDTKQVTEVIAEVINPETTQTPVLAIFLTIPTAVNLQEQSATMAAMFNQTLTKKLPAFMKPGAYIAISETPLTATGKTDRKALRELGRSYVPPAVQSPETPAYNLTEMELALRDLWASLLNIDVSLIGPDHHFVDIGGDSIKIMSLTMAIRSKWNVNIKASALLGPKSSLRESAILLESLFSGQSIAETEDLNLEQEIDMLSNELKRSIPTICGSCDRIVPPTSTVFLTGATGYLGTQILRYLLESGLQRIIALVRPFNEQNGFDRIVKAAKVAGWWRDSFVSRIDIWSGDLARPKLGLLPGQWDTLCGTQTSYGVVDVIIHNGAVVHWSTGYDRLKAANVKSTLQLLQASMQSPFLNRFVYISGGQTIDDDSQSEADGLTGYDQTKRVSEKLVQVASQLSPGQHGKFSTIKPGLIIGDVQAGILNSDDFLWRIVVAAVKLGVRPQEDPSSWLTISDVKTLSGIILDQTFGCTCKVPDFLDVTRGLPTESFWLAVEDQLQVELKPLPMDLWIDLAREDIAHEKETHPLWPVQQFLGNLGVNLAEGKRSSLGEIENIEAAIRSNVLHLEKSGLIGRNTAGEKTDRMNLVTRTKFGR